MITLPNTLHHTTDEEIRRAFETLTEDQQRQFLALHEGHRPFNTKLARIYNANVFGIPNDASYLFLNISRINHSCIPNANTGDISDTMRVVAIRPISMGEEIFISYHTMMNAMTQTQRLNYLHWSYGFQCRCIACSLDGEKAWLSDGRRRIYNVLSAAVQGYQPSDFGRYNYPSHEEVISEQRYVTWQSKLSIPLSPRQKLAYHVLLAGLMQAEDLVDQSVAHAYSNAATILLEMMYEHEDLYILPAVAHVLVWMEKAIAIMTDVCGKTSPEVQQVQKRWAYMQRSKHIRVCECWKANSPRRPFALLAEQSLQSRTWAMRELSQGEFEKLISYRSISGDI